MDNAIQEGNKNILRLQNDYPETFAAQVLVNLFLIPQLSSSDKNYDNNRAFWHDHFFDHVNFSDEQIIYSSVLPDKYLTYLEQYTEHSSEGFEQSVDVLMKKAKGNKTVENFTVQYLLNLFSERGPDYLVDHLLENYVDGCSISLPDKASKRMEEIKRSTAGQPAPDLKLVNPLGNIIDLDSVASKNKITVLFIWSPSCEHCHEQLPEVMKLYDNYKSKGLEIIAAAFNAEKAEWLKSISDSKTTWINVLDNKDELFTTYNLKKTPTYVLIDSKGIILAREYDINEVQKKVLEVVK